MPLEVPEPVRSWPVPCASAHTCNARRPDLFDRRFVGVFPGENLKNFNRLREALLGFIGLSDLREKNAEILYESQVGIGYGRSGSRIGGKESPVDTDRLLETIARLVRLAGVDQQAKAIECSGDIKLVCGKGGNIPF